MLQNIILHIYVLHILIINGAYITITSINNQTDFSKSKITIKNLTCIVENKTDEQKRCQILHLCRLIPTFRHDKITQKQSRRSQMRTPINGNSAMVDWSCFLYDFIRQFAMFWLSSDVSRFAENMSRAIPTPADNHRWRKLRIRCGMERKMFRRDCHRCVWQVDWWVSFYSGASTPNKYQNVTFIYIFLE